jgi:hypothetical protein
MLVGKAKVKKILGIFKRTCAVTVTVDPKTVVE